MQVGAYCRGKVPARGRRVVESLLDGRHRWQPRSKRQKQKEQAAACSVRRE